MVWQIQNQQYCWSMNVRGLFLLKVSLPPKHDLFSSSGKSGIWIQEVCSYNNQNSFVTLILISNWIIIICYFLVKFPLHHILFLTFGGGVDNFSEQEAFSQYQVVQDLFRFVQLYFFSWFILHNFFFCTVRVLVHVNMGIIHTNVQTFDVWCLFEVAP